MAIFTFSTKGSKPGDTEVVHRAKEFCAQHNMNFSAVVVDLLRQWEKEQKEANHVKAN